VEEFLVQRDAYLDVDSLASFCKASAILHRTHPFD
jgi:hypothetical protein